MTVFYVVVAQMQYEAGSPIYATLDLADAMSDSYPTPSYCDELEIYTMRDESAPRYYKRLRPRNPVNVWQVVSFDVETRTWIRTDYEVPPKPIESPQERLIRWAEMLMDESQL